MYRYFFRRVSACRAHSLQLHVFYMLPCAFVIVFGYSMPSMGRWLQRGVGADADVDVDVETDADADDARAALRIITTKSNKQQQQQQQQRELCVCVCVVCVCHVCVGNFVECVTGAQRQ